jgi:hypothetical protein
MFAGKSIRELEIKKSGFRGYRHSNAIRQESGDLKINGWRKERSTAFAAAREFLCSRQQSGRNHRKAQQEFTSAETE